MKRILLFAAMLLLTVSTAWARDYTIYPIPQSMEMGHGSLKITKTVHIIADNSIDAATLERAESLLRGHGLTPKRVRRAGRQTTLYLRTDAPIS